MANKSKVDALRAKGDVAGLSRMMQHATDWLNGMDAAEALAMLGDQDGIDYLLECLHDPDGEVRAIAIEMLQGLDNPRGKQALREMPLDPIYEITEDSSDISLECGNCGNPIPTNAKVCPRCGIQLYGDTIRFVTVKASKPVVPSPVIRPGNQTGKKQADDLPKEVVVVDFNIPFISLVGLLVKIALASIPALLILGGLMGLLFLLFGSALIGFLR